MTPLLKSKKFSGLLTYAVISDKKREKLSRLIIKEEFDIVIGVAGTNSMLLGAIKSKFKNRKFIGWQLNSFDAYFTSKRKYHWHQKEVFKKHISNLDEYIVLSTEDKMKIKNEFGIDSKIIYNGIQLSNNEIKDRKNIIISAGHLWSGKGFDLLIESAKIITKKVPDWEFHIYGEGPLKDELKQLIHKYKLENNVYLKGNTRELKSKIDEASIFALPSRWEGMLMVLLSALDSGIPIVSYEIPAVEFIIDNNINGHIVAKYNYQQFADKIIQIIVKDYFEDMGKKSKIKSLDFDINTIKKHWIEIFTDQNNEVK